MLILVAGHPSYNKSYFANALSEKIEAKYLEEAVIRKELQLGEQLNEEVKKRIYDEMIRQTKDYTINGVDVVVDASFDKAVTRDLYQRMAEENNSPFYLIEIKEEKEIIKGRSQKKGEQDEMDFEGFQIIENSFETIEQDHLVLCADSMSLEDMLENAISYVNLVLEQG